MRRPEVGSQGAYDSVNLVVVAKHLSGEAPQVYLPDQIGKYHRPATTTPFPGSLQAGNADFQSLPRRKRVDLDAIEPVLSQTLS